ncbi:DegT/DnrJ/EryC1/StrS family aminotransferase [Rhodococcus sp. AG1013]|uniref:DegT/DnrJ/EryC1/StrS family aminotransferase n=1 Tax=unclassified Rhodococcus (in: high G+C Gram-positive bacteria) TaxID=192944 RepID=UPI000E0B001D|nr:DegT/DnrJ/EryC1/StrS family aminotransferase [Rhodococcus sp. AG1013]RDI17207.1 dTDP-4-amino-4,6-dideoxygalactose transaminase [Rhodococcus sp. AG1013]
MIAISSISFGEDVEREVLDTLRSGIVAQGPKVKRLEEEFAALVGVRHAVAVNNGTTALVAALQVQDLQPGDEVLTSPFTFVATLNAILEAGATARFADISEADFNLDPAVAATRITDRTKVLLPVHLYGQSADMAALMPLAAEHGLSVVEDAAQAHGATFDGRGAGSFGLGCFSFYATKNLTTAEGGMITTDDDVLADRLRVLRNQGMRERYVYEMAGQNYRMTDLQASLALPQMASYPQQVEARRRNAEALQAGLKDVAGLQLPSELPGREHVWHQFTLLLAEDAPIDRDTLSARLTERGVGSGIYYPKAVYDYECYREHPRVVIEDTPVATSVAARCLSIPVHARLSESDVDQIIAAVRGAMEA